MPLTGILVEELRKISCDPHKFDFSKSDTKVKLSQKVSRLDDIFHEINIIFNTYRNSQHLDDHLRLVTCFGITMGVATGDGWSRVKDMEAIKNYANLKGYEFVELDFDMYAGQDGHKSILIYRQHR